MREGSDPNFAPPTEEGMVISLEDENGDVVDMEFLGLLLHNDRRYAFFFPVTEDEPATSSGEVVILEVTELDEEEQPSAFEVLDDDAILDEVYEAFQEAAKDLYDFE